MATHVFKNPLVSLQVGSSSAVSISDHVTGATLNFTPEVLDETAMGDNTRNRIVGLNDWNATLELHQDFAASNIDATMWSIITNQASSSIALKIRQSKSASIAATNPEYQGNVILESYNPFTGTVGELATTTVSLQGNGDLTRDTTP